ncbi:hypothetical protein NC651_012857 [Populus alba x Populus x berolinensis]|nr:hypothetical protein NC651_012857 [Populus alba x Populus x berolinensis]
MGVSEPGKVCKNHPYHDQKQGVCASCLRERLTQLIYVNTLQAAVLAPPSSSSSPDRPYSFVASTNHVSRRQHHRNISDNYNIGSVSFRTKEAQESRTVTDMIRRVGLLKPNTHGLAPYAHPRLIPRPTEHPASPNEQVKFPAICAISLEELRPDPHFSHPFLIGFSWKIESTTKLNPDSYQGIGTFLS